MSNCKICGNTFITSTVAVRENGKVVGFVCASHSLYEVIFAKLSAPERLTVSVERYEDVMSCVPESKPVES